MDAEGDLIFRDQEIDKSPYVCVFTSIQAYLSVNRNRFHRACRVYRVGMLKNRKDLFSPKPGRDAGSIDEEKCKRLNPPL